MHRVILPWPPRELSPNSRVHWAQKARIAKSYRHACGFTCQAAGARALGWAGAVLTITFQPPDRRAYDADNLIARMKAGLDGIADATGINDKLFSLGAPVIGEPVKGGCVLVEIIQP